jgi:hypothetical protein
MLEAITQSRLKELLRYEPETGNFYWRVSKTNSVKSGDIAGHFSALNGYHHVRLDWRLYRAHRLAWLYVYGSFPENVLDHINGVGSDNRIVNLRAATETQNKANAKTRKDNTSSVKGVSLSTGRKKWLAQISVKGKQTYLGRFDTIEEARAAYTSAAKRVFKEFARLA